MAGDITRIYHLLYDETDLDRWLGLTTYRQVVKRWNLYITSINYQQLP